jgi:hypothetical protein
MTARTTIESLSGATLAISATLPATYDSAGYTATAMVYTAIGQVEDFGNHGVKKTITTFVDVATATTQKVPGAKDYGKKTVMVGNIPADVGQVIIDTAVESTAHFSLKVTYPLGAGEATPETHYLDVLVAGREWQDGNVNSVRKAQIDFEICKKPVVVQAT